MELSQRVRKVIENSSEEKMTICEEEVEIEGVSHLLIQVTEINDILFEITKMEKELEKTERWYRSERDNASKYLNYKIAFETLVKEISK